MRVPTEDQSGTAGTFVDILGRWARVGGAERLAFAFSTDGGDGPDARLTYAALDLRARAIAAGLQDLGLAGERAILAYPPGLDFIAAFFGCLYGGVVAVPAHLPRPNRPMTRLRSIAADAGPRAVLTTSGLLGDAERWTSGVPELSGLPNVATDALDDDLAAGWCRPGLRADDLAFLQYTSGSTSTPKGVMVTHGNLLANSAQIRECFGSTPESRGVFWLPLFHDMGLIGGVLQTIYCGGSSTLLSPVAFLQRPLRWLKAISETGATISGGPDFAYDLCVRKIGPEQRAGLDLSRWEVAFNGAEPIRPETLDRFAEAFAPCGFRREAFLPCYGLAESTLLVSGKRSGKGPTLISVRASSLGRHRRRAALDARRSRGRSSARGDVPAGRRSPSSTPRRGPASRPIAWARSGSAGRAWPAGTGGATRRGRLPRPSPGRPAPRSSGRATWGSSRTARSSSRDGSRT